MTKRPKKRVSRTRATKASARSANKAGKAKKSLTAKRAKTRKPARKSVAPKALVQVAAAAVYNRKAALAYARANWTRVCTDGYIGSSTQKYFQVDKGTVFERKFEGGLLVEELAREPNGQTYPIKVLDDCAHFLSCCIGQPPGGQGGGLALARDYPNGPYGILGARRLFEFLNQKKFIEVVATQTTDPAFLDELVAGDLIFYWKGDHYHHAAMYMADPQKRISCHTYCRSDQVATFNQSWDSVGATDSYTFARIVA